MKRYLLLFLLLGLSSCVKDPQENSVPLIASEIIGSWQIVSESYSIGGPQIIEKVKDGGIYSFRLDGSFTFNYGKNASLNFAGTFNFEEDILTIDYVLDGSKVTRKLKVLFDDNMVVLIPWDPICIEGCSTTLQRID